MGRPSAILRENDFTTAEPRGRKAQTARIKSQEYLKWMLLGVGGFRRKVWGWAGSLWHFVWKNKGGKTHPGTEVWEEPPPASSGRTGESAWPLNSAETPSCRLSMNKDYNPTVELIRKEHRWQSKCSRNLLKTWYLYNFMSIKLPPTRAPNQPSFPADSSLSFPFLCWFSPPLLTFSNLSVTLLLSSPAISPPAAFYNHVPRDSGSKRSRAFTGGDVPITSLLSAIHTCALKPRQSGTLSQSIGGVWEWRK